jgi:hypothetical protein
VTGLSAGAMAMFVKMFGGIWRSSGGLRGTGNGRAMHVKRANRLEYAILKHLEVVLLETLNGLSPGVCDDDVHDDALDPYGATDGTEAADGEGACGDCALRPPTMEKRQRVKERYRLILVMG